MDSDKHTIRRVAVTGASGGIGAALLKAYAAPGVTIYACGRNREHLQSNAEAARAMGAQVECDTFDVQDEQTLRAWIDKAVGAGDLDVLLINQGVAASSHASAKGPVPETADELLRELDVNARATLLAANLAVAGILERRENQHHFQLGLVSSMASYAGLPFCPGYSAGKACVRVYAEALRRLLRSSNIGVTVICPGFVVSPMTDSFVGHKPLMVSAETAARHIRAAMSANRAACVFPWVMRLAIALLPLLPEALQNWALKPFGFSVTGKTRD